MKQKQSSNPKQILTPTHGATATAHHFLAAVEDNSDPFLCRKELAGRLQVSLRTIDRWQQLGLIPSYKVGNSVRFLWSDVCAYLRRNFRLTPGGLHE